MELFMLQVRAMWEHRTEQAIDECGNMSCSKISKSSWSQGKTIQLCELCISISVWGLFLSRIYPTVMYGMTKFRFLWVIYKGTYSYLCGCFGLQITADFCEPQLEVFWIEDKFPTLW